MSQTNGKHTGSFCALCHIWLAPYDSEKVQFEGSDVHEGCRKKEEKQREVQIERLIFLSGIATACCVN